MSPAGDESWSVGNTVRDGVIAADPTLSVVAPSSFAMPPSCVVPASSTAVVHVLDTAGVGDEARRGGCARLIGQLEVRRAETPATRTVAAPNHG